MAGAKKALFFFFFFLSFFIFLQINRTGLPSNWESSECFILNFKAYFFDTPSVKFLSPQSTSN